MEKLINVLSGEFFLNHRPNGGTAVFLRSVWVTALIYSVVIPIKSYCGDHAVLQFSAHQLKIEIGETIPWLGAIFAGAYAAFYSRFAAQWNYLANLYNQLLATGIHLNKEARDSSDDWNIWCAAFVEDAIDLHLARKSMFRFVIAELLQRPRVVAAFVDSTDNGAERLVKLRKQLKLKADEPPSSAAGDGAGLGADVSNVVELPSSERAATCPAAVQSSTVVKAGHE